MSETFPNMVCPNCTNTGTTLLMDYTGQFVQVYRYTCPRCRGQLMVPIDTHYHPVEAHAAEVP